MFISPTAAADYNERFRDMYTFSELILNIRKVGKIDRRKMQGQIDSNKKNLYTYFHYVRDRTHYVQERRKQLINWSLKGQPCSARWTSILELHNSQLCQRIVRSPTAQEGLIHPLPQNQWVPTINPRLHYIEDHLQWVLI